MTLLTTVMASSLAPIARYAFSSVSTRSSSSDIRSLSLNSNSSRADSFPCGQHPNGLSAKAARFFYSMCKRSVALPARNITI